MVTLAENGSNTYPSEVVVSGAGVVLVLLAASHPPAPFEGEFFFKSRYYFIMQHI
jgi:hypothetical protein